MKIGLRELLFLAVMLGLLGCSWYFVFNKANAKREEIRADIESKQRKLAMLQQNMSGVQDPVKAIGELQQAISFFESKLPKQKEIDKILKDIWRMAEANNLQMKTIRTLKTERAANYSDQPIDVSLAGNFEGYYLFLQQLEKLPRITRVTQMKLEKINDNDGAMQAQMTMSIFFEPEAQSVATAK